MGGYVEIIVFLVLLVLGFVFGRRAENRHYREIFSREEQYRDLFVSNSRFPEPEHVHHSTCLVSGNVVISVDYFKVVVAGLRMLVGGRLRSYESLIDRARRESVLRMQQEAESVGATVIINTKFETSQVAANAGNGAGAIEVLSYGTALIPPR